MKIVRKNITVIKKNNKNKLELHGHPRINFKMLLRYPSLGTLEH